MGFSIPNDVPGGTTEQHAQATPDKVDIDILVAGHNLTGVQSGCAVTAQGSPNMTVAVAVGTVGIAGVAATVVAGNVTITTADATNPRFDLVVVNSAGTKSVTAGTPAALPVFPAIPANSAVLAAVYVGAGVTSIATADIVDKRVILNSSTYVPVAPSWVTIPQNWYNGAWFTAKALARAGTGVANMAIIGDSISNGVNPSSTGWAATGYPDKLRTAVLAAMGVSSWAEYYPLWSYTATPSGAQNPVNEGFPGGANLTSAWAGLGMALGSSANNVWNQTITTGTIPGGIGSAVTAFDIVYYDYLPGTWAFTIDGGQGTGTPVVSGATWDGAKWVVTTAGGGQGSGQVKRIRVTGLTSGSHAIQWGQWSTTNVAWIQGIALYNGNTTGLGFVRSVYSGLKALDAASTNGGTIAVNGTYISCPFDKVALWDGLGTSSQLTPTPFGYPTQPHLAVIAWGANDSVGLTSPQKFQVALQRHVNALRRGQANCNIVMVAVCQPDTVYSDGNFSGTSWQWATYKARIKAIADAYGCAFVDIDSRWGETPVAQGFLASGNQHPTAAGAQDIANAIGAIL